MNRKQLIGMVIMSTLLMGYNHFFLKKEKAIKENLSIQEIEKNPTSEIKKNTDDEQLNIEKILFSLENENMELKISNLGGTIEDLQLKKYKHEKFEKVKLINEGSSNLYHIISLENGEIISTEKVVFAEEKKTNNEIILLGENTLGYKIKINYTLEENYQVNTTISVSKDETILKCKSAEIVWNNNLVPTEKDLKACRNKSRINYLTHDDEFKNIKESTSKVNEYLTNPTKWIALKQRFFTSAIIAEDNFSNVSVEIEALDEKNKDILRKVSTKIKVNAKNGEIKLNFYFGPNDFYLMKKIAPKFYRNVPLGWGIFRLTNVYVIMPAFKFFSSLTANMALIILIVVLLIKLLLYPISYRSHISSIKMKHLKPKLDEMKLKFKDNMQMMQIEQMKLYKTAGVNPFGSIGLLFLQMPILIAVFNFIPNEISFRMKEFLWVSDLSTFDSIWNLPFSIPAYGDHVSLFTILMTVSTILQSLTSSDLNSQQGNMKVFAYTMPIMFMFVLNNFPAALSLYYFISNIITIIVQILIKKLTNESKITSLIDEKISSSSLQISSFAERLNAMMKKR